MKLTLDTNVLVYAVDLDAGDRHTMALSLVDRASSADCVLTLQSLSELFAVMTKRRRVSMAAASSTVERFMAVFPVVSADEAALKRALGAVRVHRLPFWDAMLFATAAGAGCRYLLSEDFQDGRTLGGVTFVNPFQPANRPLIDKLLPSRPA